MTCHVRIDLHKLNIIRIALLFIIMLFIKAFEIKYDIPIFIIKGW